MPRTREAGKVDMLVSFLTAVAVLAFLFVLMGVKIVRQARLTRLA